MDDFVQIPSPIFRAWPCRITAQPSLRSPRNGQQYLCILRQPVAFQMQGFAEPWPLGVPYRRASVLRLRRETNVLLKPVLRRCRLVRNARNIAVFNRTVRFDHAQIGHDLAEADFRSLDLRWCHFTEAKCVILQAFRQLTGLDF
jgi:hypothetical protein